jgi:hypothetical protein
VIINVRYDLVTKISKQCATIVNAEYVLDNVEEHILIPVWNNIDFSVKMSIMLKINIDVVLRNNFTPKQLSDAYKIVKLL